MTVSNYRLLQGTAAITVAPVMVTMRHIVIKMSACHASCVSEACTYAIRALHCGGTSLLTLR
jgi:hypothetical protein